MGLADGRINGFIPMKEWRKREGLSRGEAYYLVNSAQIRYTRLGRRWIMVSEEEIVDREKEQ